MSLPPHLRGLLGVRRALVADPQGVPLDLTGDEAWRADEDGAAAAVALGELSAAGGALGLGALDFVQVKAASRLTVAAARPEALLFLEVEAGPRAVEAERAVAAWSAGEPPPAPAAPVLEAPRGLTATGLPAVAAAAGAPAAPAAVPQAAPGPSPWVALRRALARGSLTEAAGLLREAADAPAAGARPEAAVPDREAFREASARLLEGVGSVLSGDTAGGARTLRDLTGEAQPNLSVRWVAAFWSARAALAGGSVEVARRHVKDALDLSRQIDVEARAASQLLAAELLLRAADLEKALAWVNESRSRYERGRDTWGLARTWLVEARIRAAAGNEEACQAAVRQAQATEPGWDGPATFLAGRALAAGDLEAAGRLLEGVEGMPATRVRKLVAAIRGGVVSQADGAEFLKLHLAPPTTAAMRGLERIADAAPRFLPAREALAWMLVKLGRYASAHEIFAWLGEQPLDPDERALVALGLRCAGNAIQAGRGGATAAPHAAHAGETTPPPRPLAGDGDAGAVFSGRLSSFALPDLLEFLRSARRSGLLVCSSPDGMGTMRFRQGYVTDAGGAGAPSLRQLLERDGPLGAEAQQAVEGLVPGGEEEEAALRRDGLVPRPALDAALRQRIDLTVRQLMRWSDGEFAFSKEEADASGPGQIVVDAQELLLNIFKEQDESSQGQAAGSRG